MQMTIILFIILRKLNSCVLSLNFIAMLNFHLFPIMFFLLFRSFDPSELIEMDRFVVTLEGKREELATRLSRQSTSTMKDENGMTINRVAQVIQDMVTNSGGQVTDSFCGLPHHLYLPR